MGVYFMDKENKPIRILQIVGIVCGGGVEAVIMNYYRNLDKK
jgi:glycosyltransferase EpsF